MDQWIWVFVVTFLTVGGCVQVLKNMSADSDSSRLLLMRQGALETGTSWIRALVRERRQNMEQDAGVAGDGAVRAGSNGSGSGSQSLKRMKIEAHVRSVLIQTMALLRNMAVLRYVYSIFSSIFLSWHGYAHREVGGWGRDPKKCTGRDWGMGSSTI